jgi:hypothetical protein
MSEEQKIITHQVDILSQSSYERLTTLVPGGTCYVSSSTTELQAGYQLGVQAVLQVLRGNFVSGR